VTCFEPTPTRSAWDLPVEVAAERPAALRREGARDRLVAIARGEDPDPADAGPMHRIRRAVGRRLVAIGSAIDPAIDPAPLVRT